MHSVVIKKTKEYVIGRHLTKEECEGPMKILKKGEKGNLILRNSSVFGGRISNLPRRLNRSDSIAWGYAGTGPTDLSLNVLYHYSDLDEEFTSRFVHDFVAEVVSLIPNDQPVEIHAEFICGWIDNKRKNPVAVYEGREHGFLGARLSPDHCMWTNDDRQILTPLEIE